MNGLQWKMKAKLCELLSLGYHVPLCCALQSNSKPLKGYTCFSSTSSPLRNKGKSLSVCYACAVALPWHQAISPMVSELACVIL